MENQVYTLEKAKNFNRVGLSLVQSEIQLESTICFVSKVNLTKIEQLRSQVEKENRPSYTAIVAKALAQALKEYPYANRRIYRPLYWLWGWKIQSFKKIDISIAIERDLPGEEAATFMDIIRDADLQGLRSLTKRLKELSGATIESNRQWKDYYKLVTSYPVFLSLLLLRMPYWFPNLWLKYRGGATMISSPAKYGVDTLVGSWTHPVGVSFGLVEKQVKVINDEMVICPCFDLSLNWHRGVMAGAQAAKFFARIVELIEQADLSMDDSAQAIAKQNVQLSAWQKFLEKIFKVG